MSMLTRFRKQGGFSQLLTLIEVCDPIKQKNLLHLVGSEDPGWAYLLRSKVLTRDRVIAWPPHILIEITPHLSDQIILAIHSSIPLDLRQHFLANLPHGVLLRLADQLDSPVPLAERNAASVKLIQLVRDLEAEGKLKFANFDPSLCIDSELAA